MSFGLVVVLVASLFAVPFAIGLLVSSQRRSGLAECLAKVPELDATHSFISGGGDSGIAIDEKRQKLCLLNRNEPAFVVGFQAVVSAELVEDGVTVQKTDRGSQLAGAAVGTALLGVPGLLMGGLTASTTSKPKILRCELRLIIDDLSRPTHTLTFFSSPRPFDRNSAPMQELLKGASHWHGLMQVVIRRGTASPKPIEGTVGQI